jgi:hypothetical protein
MQFTTRDALKSLGDLIDQSRFSVRHVDYRQRPAIRVVSLSSCSMTDTIIGEPRGHLIIFRWSWGDPVGTSTDLRTAAENVMRVLDIQ